MKTQGTKLVARIAMALLAGMMVLALASCGSKNPLKGHTYEGHDETWVFTSEKECTNTYTYDGDTRSIELTYTLDPATLSGMFYEGGREWDPFGYKEDGSSISYSDNTYTKVK